jgi:tetratricopeptide (TPR) repeat protein
MPDVLSLEALKAHVENRYPQPIAAAARRARITHPSDLGSRQKGLIDLFEVTVRFLAIVQLQELRGVIPSFRSAMPADTFGFLRAPSVGQWAQLLQLLSSLSEKADGAPWSERIREWYQQPWGAELHELRPCLEALDPDSRAFVGTRVPISRLCEWLVNYRNRRIGHGALLTPEALGRQLPSLEGLVAGLLRSAKFLERLQVCHVSRIEVADGNQWLVHATMLCGTQDEPAAIVTGAGLQRFELYATDSTRPLATCVPLSPFLVWQPNPESKQNEVYVYGRAYRTFLEYQSFASGAHFQHKDVHRALRELVDLEIHPTTAAEGVSAPGDSRDAAERLVQRATVFRERGRSEDALQLLERSIEFDRRASTFLLMAELQQELGDPVSEVQRTVESALELDPSAEALAFLARLRAADDARSSAAIEGTGVVAKVREPPAQSVFHALTPASIRGYAAWWWAVLLGAWYAFSAACSAQLGLQADMAGAGLQWLSLVTGIALMSRGPGALHRLKSSLALQLESARPERFEQWYADQMPRIFGPAARLRSGGLLKSIGASPAYWRGLVLWLAIFVSACLYLTGSSTQQPIVFAKRFVDYGLMMFVAYAYVQYVVGTTLLVRRLATQPLRPILTALGEDGLRAFGPMHTLNVLVLSLEYGAFWLLASIVVVADAGYIDLVCLGIGTVLFLCWTLLTPLYIRQTMHEARVKALQGYANHVENAFAAFLKNPVPQTHERYTWLLNNQQVIQRMPLWPLNWQQTVFGVIGGNVVLAAVDAWYVSQRLNLSLWGGP